MKPYDTTRIEPRPDCEWCGMPTPRASLKVCKTMGREMLICPECHRGVFDEMPPKPPTPEAA